MCLLNLLDEQRYESLKIDRVLGDGPLLKDGYRAHRLRDRDKGAHQLIDSVFLYPRA